MVTIVLMGMIFQEGVAHACSVKKDFPYPIVVHADSNAHGFSVRWLSGWSYDGRTWQRVPFQVDEVNARGEYVLAEGLPYTAASDDGLLDGKDEISFYGSHLGKDFAYEDAPAPLRQSALRLWKVKVCDGPALLGHLLVVADPTTPPMGEVTRLDLDAKEIHTPRYRYRFHRDHPVLLGDVWLRDEKGKEAPLFDASAFRLAFRLPWYLPDVTLTENNFHSSIESWQSGPVRTIVAVGVKLKKLFSLFDFHMFSELVFYDNFFQIPTVMEFPLDAGRVLKAGSGLAYAIRFAEPAKWRFESDLRTLPPEGPRNLQGYGSAARKQYMAAVTGPQGVIAMRVVLDSPQESLYLPAPYAVTKAMFADAGARQNWPWLSGLEGDSGIFVDISSVREGIYNFRLDLLLESGANTEIHEILTSPKADWVTLVPR